MPNGLAFADRDGIPLIDPDDDDSDDESWHPGDAEDSEDSDKKKDKKLVFLSRSVLQKVRERPMVTGTQIANEILEMYKKFCEVSFPDQSLFYPLLKISAFLC